MFGFDLWSRQVELALSVLVHPRSAARSGHKVGKTELAAALLLWWCCTRVNARGIFTAPTLRQVEEALWAAIRRLTEVANERGYNLFPEVALSPSTGIRWEDGRRLFGFTASHPDKVSGPSGANILFVLDEASGIEAGIWEAVQGILAGTDVDSGRVLAIGNPTQPSGWFFNAFNDKRAMWNGGAPLRISCMESPNVLAGRMVIPGLVGPDYVRQMAEEYGVDSPTYQYRVLGDFPTNASNQVIGLGIIEAALGRWNEMADEGRTLYIGVDVARFGDDYSACSARRGQKLFSPKWFADNGVKAVVNGYDSQKVAGVVLQCIRALRRPGEPVRVNIDAAGGYGGPVGDWLRDLQERQQLDEFITFSDIQVAERSSQPENYPRLRDELWFTGREFFRDGGALYPDPALETELIAPTYSPTVKGQNQVEQKLETKKRLGRSPDRADSALLAIYDGAGTAVDAGWAETFNSMSRFEPNERGF